MSKREKQQNELKIEFVVTRHQTIEESDPEKPDLYFVSLKTNKSASPIVKLKTSTLTLSSEAEQIFSLYPKNETVYATFGTKGVQTKLTEKTEDKTEEDQD
jgi:hypothetical protein